MPEPPNPQFDGWNEFGANYRRDLPKRHTAMVTKQIDFLTWGYIITNSSGHVVAGRFDWNFGLTDAIREADKAIERMAKLDQSQEPPVIGRGD